MKDFVKILLRFVPPYRKYLLLNIVFNLLAAVLTLFSFALIIPILEMLFQINTATYSFMPLGTASLKEVAVNNFYYYTQESIASMGAASTLALLAATFLSSYFIVPLRSGIVRDLRNFMYRKITTLPIGFFTAERKGDVMARISGDVAEIENSVMASLDMLFKNPVLIVVYLGTMLAISWQLTLFVFVLLPIAGYVMGKVGKRLKRTSYETQTQWGTIMAIIEETLGGLRVIKAFTAEDKVRRRFIDENQRFFNLSNRVARRQALAHPMSELLGTTAIAIILWFGGSLIIGGHSGLSAASFIYYMVIFYSIINPAKELSKAAYSIQKGLASMERVDMILNADNPVKTPDIPAPMPAPDSDIALENLSFSYDGTNEVLSDIDLHIPAGATVALVGQSGSGKSTMADLIPRFYDPTAGRVTIGGTDIRNLDIAALRSLTGIVSQEPILFNDTVAANIAFGVDDATREQIVEAARVANAHEFISEMEAGYDTPVGDRGCRLSGGQRQRISIARAILKNPPILILDEATSALDSQSEALVQQALERLMQRRTTLVIAHRLSTIRNADLICVLHQGRIVERGTHASLMAPEAKGFYRRLVEMQSAE